VVAELGDPELMVNSASVGKAFTKIALQLAVDRGYIESADDIVSKYWTGRGQMSDPAKEMDRGHHVDITFRRLAMMRGGFPISNGYQWRNGAHPE
jgi:CubicO group peptidase (beta-lactamase class C family)